MSLYRAGLKLAFFLPLGVTSAQRGEQGGFADVSSVFHFILADERDPS
jgi:hypothetical protein